MGKIKELSARAMNFTGFNPTSLMITAGIAVIGLVGHFADRYFNGLSRYNDGFEECGLATQEAEDENQVEVDGYLFEYQEASDAIEDEVQNIIIEDAAQSGATVADLNAALKQWQDSQDERNRRNEDPKTDWHSDDVPDDVRLRFRGRDKSRR